MIVHVHMVAKPVKVMCVFMKRPFDHINSLKLLFQNIYMLFFYFTLINIIQAI